METLSLLLEFHQTKHIASAVKCVVSHFFVYGGIIKHLSNESIFNLMQTSLGLGENIFDNVAVLQKKQTAVTY